jgi:aminopeptidase N
METNVKQEKTFQVKHERYTKKGRYALEDPRDIYEMTANQGARRLRACILGIIPGDVIDAAVSQCEQTLKAKADTSPEALKKLVEAFAPYKVTKEQIEKRIQRRLDTITPAQLIQLRKIYNSLKDGMSGPLDWFDAALTEERAPADASVSLKNKLKNKQDKEPSAAVPDPEPAEMAPAPCPDNPETTYTWAFCSACKKFVGCPAWG